MRRLTTTLLALAQGAWAQPGVVVKPPETECAAVTEKSIGPLFPGLVEYTNGLLFRDLWLRLDLAPRDRSLVTVSVLITSDQVTPLAYHLNRAMDHGLTQTQAAEVATHLALYAGWPYAVSALPVMKVVFAKRPHKRSGWRHPARATSPNECENDASMMG